MIENNVIKIIFFAFQQWNHQKNNELIDRFNNALINIQGGPKKSLCSCL